MQNQNHEHSNGMSMMWLMMLCCILPLMLLAIFGRSAASLPRWLTPVFIAAMFGAHLLMMRRHHDKSNNPGSKGGTCDAHDHRKPKEQEPPLGV